MSEEKEPHLIFREAVNDATAKAGGNMGAFTLLYYWKDEHKGPQLTWAGGGPANLREMLAIEIATSLVERILPAYDSNLAAAFAILNAEIAKCMTRRKQRGGV